MEQLLSPKSASFSDKLRDEVDADQNHRCAICDAELCVEEEAYVPCGLGSGTRITPYRSHILEKDGDGSTEAIGKDEAKAPEATASSVNTGEETAAETQGFTG